ncbi:prepilin-type N-terminal cleavage/methylation domain-containing protein [Colwellia psychrerythraea]|uniref:Putative MSHA biogenesis protein MshO n=1 Tax=Colwellia psychrerythraea (strain 34H / ATCC BAA-681) TaxID=167879 RepID=Q47VF8_COLP3|nr:prepilin-type N-terminal cleavage/methylation domain-containing protein [Colwellia psychrerythraea]AAZ27638.1 putative MSHA biogenesis protein MshO [Colwellia psychrerythraea 34H]
MKASCNKYFLNKNRLDRRLKNSGFTLLELIIVIIILGIMSVGIAGFITLSTQTYLNVTERDKLLSSARFAVERLNREVRNAVPNSLRTFNNNSAQCLEFTPIKASTMYIDIPVVPDDKSGEIEVVSFVDSSGNPFACTGFCLDYVAVYPLQSSDIYDFNVNSGKGKVTAFKAFSNLPGSIWTVPIRPNAGMIFDEHSPTKRAYVFDAPVSYCVNNSELRRYFGHSFTANQSLTPTGGFVLMAESLTFDQNDLPFKVLPATLQRNAMVQIKLNFDRDGEVVSFNNDIHINNVP